MAFPSTIDAPSTPGTYLSSNPHSSLHTATNTSVVAIETKLGVNSSAVATTIDYLLKNTASSDPGHKHTVASLSDFTITSPVSGDILKYNGTKFINQGGLFKYGGSGTDGALNITSGTTTIDLANAAVVIKNYTSINISATGALAFSNPHTNGSTIILKSQGNVTLISSATPMIDASGMGSALATDAYSYSGLKVGAAGNGTNVTGGTAGTISSYAPATAVTASVRLAGKYPLTCPGGGGGSSFNGISGNGGGGGGSVINAGNAAANTNTNTGVTRAGGLGGGVLIIECAGAWNFTTASGISVKGKNGTNGSSTNDGGGGGGGAGVCIVTYNTLTANSGTILVNGGTGGTKTGTGTAGGTGGDGYSSVASNTEFV